VSAVLLLGATLLALLALLAVPVELTFRLEGGAPLAGEVGIRWLLGLVRARIPVPGAGGKPGEAAAAREGGRRPATRRVRRRASRGPGRYLDVLRQEAFRARACRLARDLARAVRVRRLRLWLRVGLDDPADTGMLWAVVGPLSAVALGLRRAEVRIEPEFAEAAFRFRTDGRVVVVPLQLLALAAAFALSPPSIRAWRTLAGRHG
jgi:hypothetical protein